MLLAINDISCILLHFHKVTRTTGGQTRAPPLTCRYKLFSGRVYGTCTTLGQKKNTLDSGNTNMVKTFVPHSLTYFHVMRKIIRVKSDVSIVKCTHITPMIFFNSSLHGQRSHVQWLLQCECVFFGRVFRNIMYWTTFNRPTTQPSLDFN